MSPHEESKCDKTIAESVPSMHDNVTDRIIARARLPSIGLVSTSGSTISLCDVKARSVVFVYPYTGRPGVPDPPNWDNIPGAHGSTPEALAFRDLNARFDQKGVGIFGLSTQSSAWQSEFVRRNNLNFVLLSDEQFEFARALDLPQFETGGVRYLKRLTLIIRDGAIENVIYPVSDPAAHAGAVLATI